MLYIQKAPENKDTNLSTAKPITAVHTNHKKERKKLTLTRLYYIEEHF